MKKDILTFASAALILAVIGGFFIFSKDAAPDFGPAEIEHGMINVGDQSELSEVYLEVESSRPGFVTIHESMGEAPGQMIGASEYFEPGFYGMTIPLTSQLIPGLVYITILHVDNGDEVFTLTEDMAAMVRGEVVRPSFEVLLIDENE